LTPLSSPRAWAREIKRDVVALWVAAHDPRVPWYAKAVAVVVAAYALSPVDIIPDFIPVLGYLDEVIILPLIILLAARLLPQPLMQEFREEAIRREQRRRLSAARPRSPRRPRRNSPPPSSRAPSPSSPAADPGNGAAQCKGSVRVRLRRHVFHHLCRARMPIGQSIACSRPRRRRAQHEPVDRATTIATPAAHRGGDPDTRSQPAHGAAAGTADSKIMIHLALGYAGDLRIDADTALAVSMEKKLPDDPPREARGLRW
jgi:uncharacterized membrane protein YkvA (DUF1232 family)